MLFLGSKTYKQFYALPSKRFYFSKTSILTLRESRKGYWTPTPYPRNLVRFQKSASLTDAVQYQQLVKSQAWIFNIEEE